MMSGLSYAVILLNWRRPGNLLPIIRGVLEAVPQAHIFLIDQAERHNRLAGSADFPWDSIWYRSHENRGPGVRFELAAQLPYDRFLCIDDDVFLEARQITGLLDALDRDTSRPHGVAGQVGNTSEGKSYLSGPQTGSMQVSVLNWVYAFTPEQAVETINLASLLGFYRYAGNADDILLSSAGELAPLIHDFGAVNLCPTCDDPEIAVWQRPGFFDERAELISKLRRVGRFHADAESNG